MGETGEHIREATTKKSVIFWIVAAFAILLWRPPALLASAGQSPTPQDRLPSSIVPTTRSGCDRGYLTKVPLLSLSCRDLLNRILHAPFPSKPLELTSNWVSDLSTIPQASRFTVPFLFRQWHFTATAGQPFSLPDIDVMREAENSAVPDSHRGWGAQDSTVMRYFQGDETEYHVANNNLLFEFRFSFYPVQH